MRLRLHYIQTVVPVVVHHVVEDLSAGEVIFSARLLVSFGCSCGVWSKEYILYVIEQHVLLGVFMRCNKGFQWNLHSEEDDSWYVQGTAPWKMLGFISIKRLRRSFTPTPDGPEKWRKHQTFYDITYICRITSYVLWVQIKHQSAILM